MSISAKVSSKSQITLPRKAREAAGIQSGDTVEIDTVDGTIEIRRTHSLTDLIGIANIPKSLRNVPIKDAISKGIQRHATKRSTQFNK